MKKVPFSLSTLKTFRVALITGATLLPCTPALAKNPKVDGTIFGATGIVGEVNKNSIVVKDVIKGGPAEGKLKAGDVITGLNNGKFKDPSKEISAAIDIAEGTKAKGKLSLKLKNGESADLQLKVLGDYAPNAPFSCPKTDKIITATAEQFLKSPNGRLRMGLLGLLATGEKKYIDAATKLIKEGKWMELTGERLENKHYCTWDWSYTLIMLSEYYLLTKDKAVLPPIKSYAISLAWGQDPKGMYGHRMSDPNNHYRAPGYGAMNITTLSACIGMQLAQKCGIKDPKLEQSVKVTTEYVRSHAWKGSFPYSGSGPRSAEFNNNGMVGMAAIAMELLGDKEATKFFAYCSATSHAHLKQGHASAYFNPLWTSLGALRAGPAVTSEYFKRIMCYHNPRRQFDGSWKPDWKAGTHDGIALLTYSMGRGKLIVTGRELDKFIWVDKSKVDDIINLRAFDMKGRKAEEILKLANSHEMPQIRRRAIGALGSHREELTPKYVEWLKNGTDEQKLTAISQYGWWIKPDVKLPHLNAIAGILTDPKQSIELRKAAAGSVAYMGETAQKYYPDILALADSTGDMGLGKALAALCAHPFQAGLVKDKDALYRVATQLVDDREQGMRGIGFKMLFGMPLEDFAPFAEKIDMVIKGDNPTWTSYSNPGNDVAPAVKLLASLNIKEGIDMALKIYDSRPKGKHMFRLSATWDALAAYRGNAKAALAQYQEKFGKDKNYGRHHRSYLKVVKMIEGDSAPPKLISMQQALAAHKK
jgi:hypothetical protein